MKKLLESLLEQDIFKPPTEEELLKRFIERYNGKQNPDGSYDFDRDVSSIVKDGRFIIKFGKVKGYFDCSSSKLTSLEGAPKYVGGYFNCSYNNLTSLEGAPKYVGGGFYCSFNKLTSLEGAPKYVGENFDCSSNKLTSLEGAPKYVGGDFVCFDNPVKFTEEEVRKVSEVKGEIFV
jgi:hypothetical protein